MTRWSRLVWWGLAAAGLAVSLGCAPAEEVRRPVSPPQAAAGDGDGEEEAQPTEAEGEAAHCNAAPAMEIGGGVRVAFLSFGDGPAPEPGQQVTVHYTGWLMDGTRFDSSRERGEAFRFELGVGKVIRGWDEGLANMKVGSRACLFIPPEMGYGPTGAGASIPPNAPLVFDVELLGVQ